MTSQGWIKLHRRLTQKAFYRRPYYLALWVHMLLSANHDEKEFIWNGSVIKVKKGQFITGRKQLSEQSGISESSVEDILRFLEKEQQIRQQKTNKYRLITILKWNEYQKSDNKPTTSRQQADTNKNDKKEKNIIGDKSQENMSIRAYNENQHQEDLPEIDDNGEVIKKEKKVRYYTQVYDVFKNFHLYSIDWIKNTTEQTAGDNLYSLYGIEQIEKALMLYKENKDNEFCPRIYSPSTLIRKWKQLLDFKKKNNL